MRVWAALAHEMKSIRPKSREATGICGRFLMAMLPEWIPVEVLPCGFLLRRADLEAIAGYGGGAEGSLEKVRLPGQAERYRCGAQ